MPFLYSVHEMYVYRAFRACLSVSTYVWFNSKTGQIRMKFGVYVMQLGTTLKSYFTIFYNW
jgi:hypothetical protein